MFRSLVNISLVYLFIIISFAAVFAVVYAALYGLGHFIAFLVKKAVLVIR
jgi:hypothetical protein